MDLKSIQSSSSSHSNMIWKNDVFLSFRGEDTRNNFIDHLFEALQRKGIVTFKDDKKLKKGKPISPELLQGIEESQVVIVVLSKNYASSTWCLQELVKIMDCVQVRGRSVFPVFYDVTPSEVRKQSGSFEKAISEHEKQCKGDLEVIQRWREALTQVANLSGWDVQNKPQYAVIDDIVREVSSILGHHKVSYSSYDLVGFHSRVEELEKLLVLDSQNDTRVIGICGMDGTGKTTLASVIYERIAHQFDASCFIDDLSRVYQDCGVIGVQKQLLSQTLNENLEISNYPKAKSLISTRLRHLKVLIVLDNVENSEQLDKLAVNRECVGLGSRIIVISRDGHVSKEYGVDGIYNTKLLNKDEALQLFCHKAFKSHDLMRGFKSLTYDALEYAQGHPLAIKVLGSFLFGRDVVEWKSALLRMRKYPMKDIMDVLRISFDALEQIQKEIFLDIACFFNLEPLSDVKKILDYRGFYPDIGISDLVEKSLLTISPFGSIRMHSLLEELGKKVVREKSPQDPGKWSRLWRLKDIRSVLSNNTATENIEAIFVTYLNKADPKARLVGCEALTKMTRLRILKLSHINCSGSNLASLSNELCYLSWSYYPFTCLPSSFQPDDLVELKLPCSNINKLWEGVKHLHKLKVLNLSNSKKLVETPDFRGIPNLEELCLGGCTKLVYVNSSIGLLHKLTILKLGDCTSLMSLPESIFHLTSLVVLDLRGCSNLFDKKRLELKEPREGEPLKMFDVGETGPLLLWPTLLDFCLLCELDLSFCNLSHIPDEVEWLSNLRELYLGGNKFVRLPSTLKRLSKLTTLFLQHCKHLVSLPELTTKSTKSALSSETSFVSFWLEIFDCPKLTDINGCTKLAFLWMVRAFQMEEDSCFPHHIKIVIPGSEIPMWFNNQSAGNLLVTKMDNNNWIGIVVCVSFLAYHDPNIIGESPSLWCRFGDHHTDLMIMVQSRVKVKSEHLTVILFTRKYLSWAKLKDTTMIHFEFPYKSGNGFHVEVKKCGLRWVFKEDMDELINLVNSRGSRKIQIHDHLGIGNHRLVLRDSE